MKNTQLLVVYCEKMPQNFQRAASSLALNILKFSFLIKFALLKVPDAVLLAKEKVIKKFFLPFLLNNNQQQQQLTTKGSKILYKFGI